MGQVTVTFNGRTYRLTCGDGEESRLVDLADYFNRKIEELVAEFGHPGDDRLTVMAALLITDELFEAREALGSPGDDAASDTVRAAPLAITAPEPAVTETAPTATEQASVGPAEASSPVDAPETSTASEGPVRLSLEQRLARARAQG